MCVCVCLPTSIAWVPCCLGPASCCPPCLPCLPTALSAVSTLSAPSAICCCPLPCLSPCLPCLPCLPTAHGRAFLCACCSAWLPCVNIRKTSGPVYGLPVSQWCSNNTLISVGPFPSTRIASASPRRHLSLSSPPLPTGCRAKYSGHCMMTLSV